MNGGSLLTLNKNVSRFSLPDVLDKPRKLSISRINASELFVLPGRLARIARWSTHRRPCTLPLSAEPGSLAPFPELISHRYNHKSHFTCWRRAGG